MIFKTIALKRIKAIIDWQIPLIHCGRRFVQEVAPHC